jgi:hypothetical protein
VIALIGNRPVLQVGRHQVSCYDSQWLRDALCRAADDADRADFPLVDEICQGIFHYLENKCPLKLLPLPALYDKMRKMLESIGCDSIAGELKPYAPPVQVCLLRLVKDEQCAFEMSLFQILKREVEDLRAAGADEIRFLHVHECVMHVLGAKKWDKSCLRLRQDISAYLQSCGQRADVSHSSHVILHMCAPRKMV